MSRRVGAPDWHLIEAGDGCSLTDAHGDRRLFCCVAPSQRAEKAVVVVVRTCLPPDVPIGFFALGLSLVLVLKIAFSFMVI